ncbi:MAG TPA: ABC transporter ATP-binding protein [Thalassospira sp.]|nr:ABC transporter ATP-binding protein [Thalassospira sp.]|tara:strand:- start:605 stop:1432 length:828 start_codon:yes stop_codon:yes gene_type:complete
MIRLSNVQKTYAARRGSDEHIALRGINLDIAAGEIVGVIGRSGAGKSTLIRCINLLETPTSGTVTVDGTNVTTLSKRDLPLFRRQLGMVFQHFNLLSSRTVFDNIALPLELAGATKADIAKAVDPLLPLVGLEEKRDRYPAELSGGQKQRVGIARALSSNPKVLLCDEVTSALDPETTRQILTLLKDINKRLGLTMVVITHEMAVVKALCDRVAVMDGGVIVEEGAVDGIFADPGHATTQSLLADEFMDFRAGSDANNPANNTGAATTATAGQEG